MELEDGDLSSCIINFVLRVRREWVIDGCVSDLVVEEGYDIGTFPGSSC
jgi:hypothetical protein